PQAEATPEMVFRRLLGSLRGLRTARPGAGDDGLNPQERARLHAGRLEALVPLDEVPVEEEAQVLALGVLWAEPEVGERGVPGAAAVVGQRLQEVDAAGDLGDLRLLPHLRVVADDDEDEVIVEGRDGIRLRLAPQQGNPNRRGAVPWHEAQTVVVLDVV